MKKALTLFCRYDRHKRVQLLVTGGTLIGAVIVVAYPQASFASAVVGTAVNIIWVWE